MATETRAGRYPEGSGWVVGFLVGVAVGAVAWYVSDETTVALILFVATGTALGVVVEQSIDTRPLTRRERWAVWAATVLGLLVLLTLMLVP